DRDDVRDLINPYASNQLRDALRENPELLNTTQTMTFLSHTDVDVYVKHAGDENYSIKLNEKQQAWVDALYE
ncbi:MAG TPA: phosphate ABC transporter, permease protein PstA, partial [Marinobacter hydrocarbonoclasticus]|nr:phosphate ABC transporter, permease protein PstA [Marinobacter nauticus]